MKLVGDRYVDENGPDEAQPGRAEVVAEGVERPPAKVNRWLVVGLVVSLLALVGLGTWTYLEHRQSADEKAVADVVAANQEAWDAGDGAGVLATMTRGGTWVAASPTTSKIANGPFSGPRLAEFVREMEQLDFSLEATGPPTVVGGQGYWTAVAPVRIAFTVDLGDGTTRVTQDGVTLFVVVDSEGPMLIRAESWFPEGE